MTPLLKIVLISLFVVFVAGTIWAYVVLKDPKKDEKQTSKPTPTEQKKDTTAPISPVITTDKGLSETPTAKKTVTKQKIYTTYYYEYFDEDVTASASASASANGNSAHAEAHAE